MILMQNQRINPDRMPKETWEAVKRGLGIEIDQGKIEREAKAARRVNARDARARSREAQSNVTIKVLEQRGNHAQSMEILAKNGLKPLTHQEALTNAPELIKTLKGKWFYLDEKGIKEEGIYTFNEREGLVKPTGNEALDKKVHVYSGSQLLSLGVNSDNGTRGSGRRFILNGGSSPVDVAEVVVGVKIGNKVATPKNFVNGVVVDNTTKT